MILIARLTADAYVRYALLNLTPAALKYLLSLRDLYKMVDKIDESVNGLEFFNKNAHFGTAFVNHVVEWTDDSFWQSCGDLDPGLKISRGVGITLMATEGGVYWQTTVGDSTHTETPFIPWEILLDVQAGSQPFCEATLIPKVKEPKIP